MKNNLINTKKEYYTHLITQSHNHPITLLRNVTNIIKNRQLITVTCFIIYVGLNCIGVEAYA